MARSSTPPSSPQLASGWGLVQRAWDRKEDIAPWLDAIDWDSPVFVWGQKTPQEHTGALQHPLAYALSLNDRALGQAVVEAKAMHPWPSVPITQLQSDKGYPLPALSDLWEWDLAQAVVENKAFKALPLLADGIARGIGQHRYPSLACNALGKVLATAPWEAPAICQAIDTLQPCLNAHLKPSDQSSLAWNVVMEACKAGKGDVAVGVFQRFPQQAKISLDFLKDLAGFEQFSQALFLLEQNPTVGGPGRDPFQSFRGDDSQAKAEAYLALASALKVIAAARGREEPSAALQKKADAAEDFLLELCRRFQFPLHAETSAASATTYAQALALVPDAFPRVKANAVVSEAVLKQWWSNGPVDGDLFKACFQQFLKVHNQDVVRRFLEEGIGNKIEAVGLNKQLPLVKKIEKLPLLLEALQTMEEPLGMDRFALVKHHMPPAFLTGKLGTHWNEVVARHHTQVLEEALPESPLVGKPVRL